MRILFVTSNRIGDAVLSTGLLGHLLDRHPGARVTIACGPAPAPLFRAVPGLETLLVLRKQPLAGHWRALWAAAIGTRWDVVLDLRASALAYLLFARERFVFRPSHDPVHRVRQLGAVFGRADDPPAPRLWLSDGDRAAAAALLPPGSPVLAVGPTANWWGKEWPAAGFVELVGRLTAPGAAFAGARVAVFGGPGEREAAAPLLAALPEGRGIDLVGTVSLSVAAAAMERARLYVGNDSGLMHMAAAAGVPTLGLFGPSRDELYAPWGGHCAALRGPRSYDEIVSAPGYDRHVRMSHLADLAVDRVEEAVLALAARTAPGGRDQMDMSR